MFVRKNIVFSNSQFEQSKTKKTILNNKQKNVERVDKIFVEVALLVLPQFFSFFFLSF